MGLGGHSDIIYLNAFSRYISLFKNHFHNDIAFISGKLPRVEHNLLQYNNYGTQRHVWWRSAYGPCGICPQNTIGRQLCNKIIFKCHVNHGSRCARKIIVCISFKSDFAKIYCCLLSKLYLCSSALKWLFIMLHDAVR